MHNIQLKSKCNMYTHKICKICKICMQYVGLDAIALYSIMQKNTIMQKKTEHYTVICKKCLHHLEPCQNPISGHGDTMSVYPDIGPDIGPDIADTRYRVFPDIGTYPISGHTRYRVSRYRDIPGPTSCIRISGYHDTRYRDIPISGHTRYRVSRYRDLITRYRAECQPDIV